jgi:hypothetical protein
MGGNTSLRGFSLAALAATAPANLAAALTRVLDQVAQGTIRVEVTVLDGLETAADAQQALAEGHGETKYVINVSGAPDVNAAARAEARPSTTVVGAAAFNRGRLPQPLAFRAT